MSQLPYDFDLLFDIKDQEQLERDVHSAAATLNDLMLLCKQHNIKLPPGIEDGLGPIEIQESGKNFLATRTLMYDGSIDDPKANIVGIGETEEQAIYDLIKTEQHLGVVFK